jgi:Rrf2 family protein
VSSLLSKPSQHAIRALVYLSGLPASDAATIQSIATITDIPQSFLAKVIRRLVEAGLLESFRGPGGGVRFARPPHRISILDVLEALEIDSVVVDSCVLGFAQCGGDHPCPMHDTWRGHREQLRRAFAKTTIADLAASIED